MKRFLPVTIVLALFILLFMGLKQSTRDGARDLPSPFIGKPFPDLIVEDFTTGEQYPIREKLNTWSIVNFWASWCVTCRAEHPVLVDIHQSNALQMIGVNYKDTKQAANQMLAQKEDPYDLIIFDTKGKVGLELGVYATPETFLIDPEGIIRHKHLGALTAEIWQQDFLAKIK